MAKRLPGAKDPPRTLGSGNNKGGPILGFGPRTDRARLGQPGHRMMRHELPATHSYIPLGKHTKLTSCVSRTLFNSTLSRSVLIVAPIITGGGRNQNQNGGNWSSYKQAQNNGSQSFNSGRTYNNQPPPSSYSAGPKMYNSGRNQVNFILQQAEHFKQIVLQATHQENIISPMAYRFWWIVCNKTSYPVTPILLLRVSRFVQVSFDNRGNSQGRGGWQGYQQQGYGSAGGGYTTGRGGGYQRGQGHSQSYHPYSRPQQSHQQNWRGGSGSRGHSYR